MRVSVEAHPNARTDRVEFADGLLRVWVRAPAIDGRANKAIERLLAKALALRPRQVQIVSGATSRHKTVEIDLVELDDIRHRLA
jgi:uncharacterized protein (TIGR00251 family)